jgi:sugar phosphate isomerase/epimerase
VNASRLPTEQPPLVLWASCGRPHDLIDRAEAVTAGGFAGMTTSRADLLALEAERGWSIERVAAELRAREAPIATFDGFMAWYPGWDPSGLTGALAATIGISADDALRCADVLGAPSMTVLAPFDSDAPAPTDEVADAFGRFADRAAGHGVRIHLEFVPPSRIPDLASAWAVVEQAGRDNAGLVMDTFHLGRSGATADDVAAIPLDKIFQIQLCDGPVEPALPNYLEEAMTRRTFAGDGELPCADYLRAMVRDGEPIPPTGPEIAMPEVSAQAPEAIGRLCAERTRAFLAEAGATGVVA